MKRIGLLVFVIAFTCLHDTAIAQTIMTIAGNGIAGYNGDTIAATSAELNGPFGVALDGMGNTYFIDQQNQRIRKIDNAGVITTIAGTGTAGYSGDSGLATSAEINTPWGIAADGSGNVYIADYRNSRIRMINSSGIITTIAGTGANGFSGDGGPATSAELYYPSGVAIDGNGNVYIADRQNQRIRKINTSGIITTIAGNGTTGFNGDNWPSATQASLNYPTGIAVDNIGNIFIADEFNSRIRKVDTFNRISTVFGNGAIGFSPDGISALNSWLYYPNGVALDSLDDIYVSDEGNHRIRKAIAGSNEVITVAGNGMSGYNGDSASALTTEIADCKGLAVDKGGNVYFADWSNDRVNYVTSTVYVKPVFQNISGVSVYPNPNQGSFTVNVISNNNEQANLIITNVLGETVDAVNIATNKPWLINLKVATGVYFLTATTPDGKWSGKLEVVEQ